MCVDSDSVVVLANASLNKQWQEFKDYSDAFLVAEEYGMCLKTMVSDSLFLMPHHLIMPISPCAKTYQRCNSSCHSART